VAEKYWLKESLTFFSPTPFILSSLFILGTLVKDQLHKIDVFLSFCSITLYALCFVILKSGGVIPSALFLFKILFATHGF
jgi:hypothetical protein